MEDENSRPRGGPVLLLRPREDPGGQGSLCPRLDGPRRLSPSRHGDRDRYVSFPRSIGRRSTEMSALPRSGSLSEAPCSSSSSYNRTGLMPRSSKANSCASGPMMSFDGWKRRDTEGEAAWNRRLNQWAMRLGPQGRPGRRQRVSLPRSERPRATGNDSRSLGAGKKRSDDGGSPTPLGLTGRSVSIYTFHFFVDCCNSCGNRKFGILAIQKRSRCINGFEKLRHTKSMTFAITFQTDPQLRTHRGLDATRFQPDRSGMTPPKRCPNVPRHVAVVTHGGPLRGDRTPDEGTESFREVGVIPCRCRYPRTIAEASSARTNSVLPAENRPASVALGSLRHGDATKNDGLTRMIQ